MNIFSMKVAELERAAAAEKESASKSATEAKAQLDAANAAVAKLTGEQKAAAEKADKLTKTITQLKQLGRKFKDQSMALTEEKNKLQKSLEEALAAQQQQQAGESAAGDDEKDKEIAELKEKLQTADDLVETTAQKIQGTYSTENENVVD